LRECGFFNKPRACAVATDNEDIYAPTAIVRKRSHCVARTLERGSATWRSPAPRSQLDGVGYLFDESGIHEHGPLHYPRFTHGHSQVEAKTRITRINAQQLCVLRRSVAMLLAGDQRNRKTQA
jgi:hypothetical protein